MHSIVIATALEIYMAFFKRQDVGQAFRNSRQLQQFVLSDVAPTGKKLGTGSFGSVEEVIYQQMICAGKRIHEALLDVENEGVPEIVIKFLQECQLMSSLHHPKITQFLGLCFLPGTQLPLLIMERLETSLDDLLENVPNLPLSTKCSILEDVASGLLYLHKRNPAVIHRDLTSRNVLLTSSLMAKITDMGNSRIADMRPGQMIRTLSALPGTLVYMPPEALDDRHRYGPSLDVFSFGHLALFTITQIFPGDLLPSTFYDAGKLQARNEVQRREQYIEILGRYDPALVELVTECLHNSPDQRPTTDDLLTRLQRMREEVEGGCGGCVVKLDLSKMKLLKEVKIKDRRIEEMTQQQQTREAESAEKTRALEAKDRELEDLTRQLEINNEQLERKDQEIASKEQEIAQQRGRVQQLQDEMGIKNEQLQRNDQEMARKNQEFSRKDRVIASQRVRVRQLQEELHQKETQLREERQSQEAVISRLREELSKCQGLAQEGAKVQLKLPLQLKWRRGPDMPFAMSGPVQAVQMQGTLYVGGGLADGDSGNLIMTYVVSADKWVTLPPCSTRWFAMTAIKNHLVLVAGQGRGGYSKALHVWRADNKKWTHSYPDMTTPRHSCSVFFYKPWLVVAGGRGAGGRKLTSVEVLNTDTKQWFAGPPIPIAWTQMQTAIVGDMCYLMGGYIEGPAPTNKVYSVSLSALISWITSDNSVKITKTWKEIPQLQVKCAAPLSIYGSLLAVGGVNKDDKVVSALHLYQPDAGQWVKVADMPTPRHDCTSVMITDEELLVTGGCHDDRLATMLMAEILY